MGGNSKGKIMLGLFRRQPLLDEASRQWLFDLYAWALRNFGTDHFYRDTRLVTPTDAHFPGRADSVGAMAELVFEQVKRHAGLSHWPTRLVPPEAFDPEARPRLALAGPIRQGEPVAPAPADDAHALTLTYAPNMVGNPEALIASFAHNLAHFLGSLAVEEPPGGHANWPQLTEVLAVFMGFGLMIANTAYQSPKVGCGSCHVPGAERSGALSQYDLTYALALFSTLKGTPNAEVLPYLKSSLKGFYKSAAKELRQSEPALSRLRAIDSPAPTPG